MNTAIWFDDRWDEYEYEYNEILSTEANKTVTILDSWRKKY